MDLKDPRVEKLRCLRGKWPKYLNFNVKEWRKMSNRVGIYVLTMPSYKNKKFVCIEGKRMHNGRLKFKTY